MINNEIPKKVEQLLMYLQASLGHKYNVTLAGGFLRDTFGERDIKDIDIMITPAKGKLSGSQELLDVVKETVHPSLFSITENIQASYIKDMSERGVVGLVMGHSSFAGYDTQLIVYKKPMTLSEIANDMDLNICQIVMDSLGNIHYTDEFVKGFRDSNIKVLHGSGDRARDRVARMLKKYPDFTVEDFD